MAAISGDLTERRGEKSSRSAIEATRWWWKKVNQRAGGKKGKSKKEKRKKEKTKGKGGKRE